MITEKMAPDARRAQILDVALRFAQTNGYRNVTRDMIAGELKIAKSTISRYFDFPDLIAEVVKLAIADRCVPIIADALADHNKDARRAVKIDPQLNSQIRKHLQLT